MSGLCFYDKIKVMSTDIYRTKNIKSIDGKEIEISPLKIKYMKEFMNVFSSMNKTENDDQAIQLLCQCVKICMKQFDPAINTVELVEDNFDLATIYEILDYAAGVKINSKNQKVPSEETSENEEKSSWEDLDLVKLEAEAFLFGIWKNFDELERSISISELMTIISTSRELDYSEKKFLAAMQGVDLDKESGQSRGQKEWEDMKARVFSKGQATDSTDILALQGQNAAKVGFGIGMGLDYEDLR